MSYTTIAVTPKDKETFEQLLDGRSRVSAFHRMVESHKAEREAVKRILETICTNAPMDDGDSYRLLVRVKKICNEYLEQ